MHYIVMYGNWFCGPFFVSSLSEGCGFVAYLYVQFTYVTGALLSHLNSSRQIFLSSLGNTAGSVKNIT